MVAAVAISASPAGTRRTAVQFEGVNAPTDPRRRDRPTTDTLGIALLAGTVGAARPRVPAAVAEVANTAVATTHRTSTTGLAGAPSTVAPPSLE